MNRLVFIPGLLLVGGFCFACCNQPNEQTQKPTQQEVPIEVDQTSAAQLTTGLSSQTDGVPAQPEREEGELLSWSDASKKILEGWPVSMSMAGGSRGGQSRSFDASLTGLPDDWDDKNQAFLTALHVYLKGESSEFPVYVDRVANQFYVHSSQKWVEYESWKAENLPRFIERYEGNSTRSGSSRGGGQRGGG